MNHNFLCFPVSEILTDAITVVWNMDMSLCQLNILWYIIIVTRLANPFVQFWGFTFWIYVITSVSYENAKVRTNPGDLVKVIDNMHILHLKCCFIIQSEKQQDREKNHTVFTWLETGKKNEWKIKIKKKRM